MILFVKFSCCIYFHSCLLCIYDLHLGQDSYSDKAATTEASCFDFWHGQEIFTSPKPSFCLWGCTQLPVDWVPGAVTLGVNQLGHVADFTSKVWDEGRYNLHFLYVFMAYTRSALQSFLSRTWCGSHYKVQSCLMVLKPQNTQAYIVASYTC
jgi:hypothetical protein